MSTVHSEPLRDGKPAERARSQVAWHRVAAVVAWLLGTFTTYLFFARAMPGASWLVSALLAGGVQWLLTIAERPLWRFLMRRNGGRLAVVGLVVTFVDGLLNAGGLYPYMGRLAQTDVGRMLAEVMNVQAAMTPSAAFLLALTIGLLLASLSEYLWESG
jgi:hypothetical protein